MAGASSIGFEETLGSEELSVYNADSEVELDEEEFDDEILLHFIADGDEEIVDFSIQDETNDNVAGPTQPKKKKGKKANSVPQGFDMNNWKEGDYSLAPLPPFTESHGFTFAPPDNANELYFFNLFLTDDLISEITNQTNLYANQYLSSNKDNIKATSRIKRWPDDGVDESQMKAFFALTFYMGIVQKDNIKSYWSTDDVMITPFCHSVMPRDKFHNFLKFLHLVDNTTYPRQGEQGYNPRKKLGTFYESICSSFPAMWKPRQHLSIDEGGIPFKGRVAFKCYNPSKPDKYHMKTFKVVDSSNNYLLKFELYVGESYAHNVTDFGKTHDLVLRMMDGYLGKSFILYMDNWYTSSYLYYNLLLSKTGACGTSRPRKGLPPGLLDAKLKTKGEKKVFTYDDKMVAMRYFDRKALTMLSTVYSCIDVDTGRKHWKTKEVVKKPSVIVAYNKKMGGVDCNDQLLKYSAFSRRTLKWWKKVFFRLLNLAMVNAFVLYLEWLKINSK